MPPTRNPNDDIHIEIAKGQQWERRGNRKRTVEIIGHFGSLNYGAVMCFNVDNMYPSTMSMRTLVTRYRLVAVRANQEAMV